MLHREKARGLGVKSCSAQEGEVDISLSLAGVPASLWGVCVCVCFYQRADWWNELWVWEIDSSWGWSPFTFGLAVVGRLSKYGLLASYRPGSSHLFSLTDVYDCSQKFREKNTRNDLVLSDSMSLGTGEAVASFVHLFAFFFWQSLKNLCRLHV